MPSIDPSNSMSPDVRLPRPERESLTVVDAGPTSVDSFIRGVTRGVAFGRGVLVTTRGLGVAMTRERGATDRLSTARLSRVTPTGAVVASVARVVRTPTLPAAVRALPGSGRLSCHPAGSARPAVQTRARNMTGLLPLTRARTAIPLPGLTRTPWTRISFPITRTEPDRTRITLSQTDPSSAIRVRIWYWLPFPRLRKTAETVTPPRSATFGMPTRNLTTASRTERLDSIMSAWAPGRLRVMRPLPPATRNATPRPVV